MRGILLVASAAVALIGSNTAQKCSKPQPELIEIARKRWMDDPTPQPGDTCVLTQNCRRDPGDPPMDQSPCPHGADPTQLNNPQIEYFKPRPFLREDSKDAFALICPGYDRDANLCCNDDQVEIMSKNLTIYLIPFSQQLQIHRLGLW
jgi:hypothetical protein